MYVCVCVACVYVCMRISHRARAPMKNCRRVDDPSIFLFLGSKDNAPVKVKTNESSKTEGRAKASKTETRMGLESVQTSPLFSFRILLETRIDLKKEKKKERKVGKAEAN